MNSGPCIKSLPLMLPHLFLLKIISSSRERELQLLFKKVVLYLVVYNIIIDSFLFLLRYCFILDVCVDIHELHTEGESNHRYLIVKEIQFVKPVVNNHRINYLYISTLYLFPLPLLCSIRKVKLNITYFCL